jgi:hypothetical protein
MARVPGLPLVVRTRLWYVAVGRVLPGLLVLAGTVLAVLDNSYGTDVERAFLILTGLPLGALMLGRRVSERMEIRGDGIALRWSPLSLGPFPIIRREAFVRWSSVLRVAPFRVPAQPGTFYRVWFDVDGRRLTWTMSRWATTNTFPALAVLASRSGPRVDPEVRLAVQKWTVRERKADPETSSG